jgi:hypothetical protein
MKRTIDCMIGGIAFALGVAAITAPLYMAKPASSGAQPCDVGAFGVPVYNCHD